MTRLKEKKNNEKTRTHQKQNKRKTTSGGVKKKNSVKLGKSPEAADKAPEGGAVICRRRVVEHENHLVLLGLLNFAQCVCVCVCVSVCVCVCSSLLVGVLFFFSSCRRRVIGRLSSTARD